MVGLDKLCGGHSTIGASGPRLGIDMGQVLAGACSRPWPLFTAPHRGPSNQGRDWTRYSRVRRRMHVKGKEGSTTSLREHRQGRHDGVGAKTRTRVVPSPSSSLQSTLPHLSNHPHHPFATVRVRFFQQDPYPFPLTAAVFLSSSSSPFTSKCNLTFSFPVSPSVFHPGLRPSGIQERTTT